MLLVGRSCNAFRPEPTPYDPAVRQLVLSETPQTIPKQPLIGVVGGIGPSASLRLEEIINQKDNLRLRQQASKQKLGFLADSFHTPLLVYNNPQIPNNNRAALGLGPSPVPALVDSCRALQKAGADTVAFCCTTAYAFEPEIAQQPGVPPILDLLQLIAQTVEKDGHTKVGLLDVDGTLVSGKFQRRLEDHSIEVVLPKPEEQEQIMEVVSDLKIGSMDTVVKLIDIIQLLVDQEGVSAVILGCTELATAVGYLPVSSLPDIEYYDSLSILADEIIRRSTAPKSVPQCEICYQENNLSCINILNAK